MKIVIIGGGIAGLAFSIIMKEKGHEVIINERNNEIPTGAHAFMMHEEGLQILQNILGEKSQIPGSSIANFLFKDLNDKTLTNSKMESWQCMKRSDLINALRLKINDNVVKYNRFFSHFIYHNNKAVAAVFENGEMEYGDIFIGSDGSHSQVRKIIFGETNFTKTEVQEILGTVNDPILVKELKGVFTKFQHPEKGISFGCIPFSENELIWFNQFDVRLANHSLKTGEDLNTFTKELLKDFPPLVRNILAKADFNQSYLWKTKDFDLLKSFHYNNIILIGDAAHLALPFTSAGTTNALVDAYELAAQIEKEADIEQAFVAFYKSRITSLKEHLEFGRTLKQQFLHPAKSNREIIIPLIKKQTTQEKHKEEKKVEIIYFTDPICSTCWTIQPQLRKLKSVYNNVLDFKYVMGGLLPSWENFNRGGICKPEDVIKHWDDASSETGIPINHAVWKDDPILSSYPPSIAFKAAQIQDDDKSIYFLRILNELVFIEGKNITSPSIIMKAATISGLDAERLMNDIQANAIALFYEDLALTKEMNIMTLPTFGFKVEGKYKEFLYGYQTYDNFENAILRLYPHINKQNTTKTTSDLIGLYPITSKNRLQHFYKSNDIITNNMINELIKNEKVEDKSNKTERTYYSIAV